ncbi:MAG TPA: aspartate carbamoyltransferase catalytic subunit [Candidatus Eisenbacteria bacterium]|nr:aspartate carbamoyltransferase catalytic subunit [Candidatus Eisenbacteria bacterium]
MTSTGLEHRPAPAGAGRFSSSSRHLLGLEGVPREALLTWLDEAAAWRARLRGGAPLPQALAQVIVVSAFFEDSTRTRMSFEIAARQLGATVAGFSAAGSSVSKGESLLDTLRTLAAMGLHVLVMRHPSAGAAALAAGALPCAVVNAGDGAHEHPTQGLLDLLTLRDAWQGRFAGRRIVIVGDIAHSRVARSAIFGLRTLGVDITVAGPPSLMPRDVGSLGVTHAPELEPALDGADAAMALRLQRERMESGLVPEAGDYARRWALTPARVARMAADAVVLHPGPMNRGIEIAPEVADGPRARVLDQVANGVAVRCAVLVRCAAAQRIAA